MNRSTRMYDSLVKVAASSMAVTSTVGVTDSGVRGLLSIAPARLSKTCIHAFLLASPSCTCDGRREMAVESTSAGDFSEGKKGRRERSRCANR